MDELETHGQTRLVSRHIPCAFSIVAVSDLPEFQIDPISYVGKDAEKKFVSTLERIRDRFHNKFVCSKRMIFAEKEREVHDAQHKCFSCGGEFTPDHRQGHKVRDHCHFTGTYRG